jgi:hypothetical protein
MIEFFCISVFRDSGFRESCEYGVSVISQLLDQADTRGVIAIRGQVLDCVEEVAIFAGGLAEGGKDFDLLRFRQLQEGAVGRFGCGDGVQARRPGYRWAE